MTVNTNRTTATLVLVLTVGLLTACTAPAPPPPVPTPTVTTEPRAAAPADTAAELIGTWTITDPSDGMSATLHLQEGGRWEAQYECGPINGQWASVGDVFLATSRGGSMGCFDNVDPQPTLAWVENTARITASDTGWALSDAAGAATGTLSNGSWEGSPPQPTVTQPLPQGFTVEDLEGRWLPLIDTPGDSYVEFGDGRWMSSDGCNGGGGRWADLGDGYILTTPAGAMTLIGCENVPVAEWVGTARTAGFDGEDLVLFDAAGEELLRLTPA